MVIALMNKTSKVDQHPGEAHLQPTQERSPEYTDSTDVRQSSASVSADYPETTDSFGRISIEDNQPNYVGSSHWAAILDNVGTECRDRKPVLYE